MVSKTIDKEYDNFYTGTKMTFPIKYTLQPGFSSVNDAKNHVTRIASPEDFVYIRVDGEIYAVTMETTAKQAVVTKGISYYRRADRSCEYRMSYDKLMERSVLLNIKKPRIGSKWCAEIKNDLCSLFRVDVIAQGENTPNSSYLRDDSIVLLSRVLFDTMVPTFYLNVMDLYMMEENSPSRWKLWQDGVTAYNYYSGEKSYDKSIVGGTRENLK